MSSGEAKGTVEWNSATNWQGTFIVNGIEKTYSATIDKALPKFEVNVASASYKDIDNNFTGGVKWHGRIGDKDIEIKLDSGVVITGALKQAITAANEVNGAGSWTSMGEEGTRSHAWALQVMTDLMCRQIDRSNWLLLRKNGRRIAGVGSNCVI